MLRKLIIVGIFLFAAQAQAELTIDITQTVEGATPIAIAPFTWTGQQPAPENIAAIIAATIAVSHNACTLMFLMTFYFLRERRLDS